MVFRLSVGARREPHQRTPPDERLARRDDPVEKLDEALSDDLGQRFGNAPPDEVVAADQRSICEVRELEDVVGPRKHRHEARRLLEERAHQADLGREQLVGRLHLCGAAEDLGLRRSRAGRAVAQRLQLGHVGRVLEDVAEAALGIEHGGVRGAPVANHRRLAGRRRVVGDEGEVVARVGRDHPVERCLEHLVARRRGVAREGVEDVAADDLVAAIPPDGLEIGVVAADDDQVGVEKDIGVRRSVEERAEIKRRRRCVPEQFRPLWCVTPQRRNQRYAIAGRKSTAPGRPRRRAGSPQAKGSGAS
jgi:hypothetical protein